MINLMPSENEVRVIKPSPVTVLRDGIEQAIAANAPRSMIRTLEEKLVAEGLIDLFQMQNQPYN